MNILDKIIAHKRIEVARLKKTRPLIEIIKYLNNQKSKPVFFKKNHQLKLIAEIKPKSPSVGIIRSNFNPSRLAKEFEKKGASAISVLTDTKFFGGSVEIFSQVRKATKLPLLRKEFIIDPYQVYETKSIGADIILLIAAALKGRIAKFVNLSLSLGLQPLIEVHNRSELKAVLKLIQPSPKIIIGINNRNLKNLEIDLHNSLRLIKHIPKQYIKIAESGISSVEDLRILKDAGFNGVLIGTGLKSNPKLINHFV